MQDEPMPTSDRTRNSGLRILRRLTVVPAKLPEPERAALSHQLYEVHSRIFSGLGPEEFRRRVVQAPLEGTIIQLYLSGEGQIAGYCAVHRFRRRARGRSVIVLQADAGLLPEYRGRSMTFGFGMRRAVVEKLRHPLTPIYYFDFLLHASSYHLFIKYFPHVFPNPVVDMPADLRRVALDLVDSFDYPPVTEADPFVRNVGWATIESAQERALNNREHRPDIAFFKMRNPGYPKGHGLAVIIPVTVGNLAAAYLARLSECFLLAVRRAHPEL